MKLTVREIAGFGLLGALMCASDLAMEALPNIHLIGVFIIATTVVYRAKALWPLYVYVLLIGLISGIGLWGIPYLYVWTVLWGMTMLLPKRMPKWLAPIVYMAVCGLHGLGFGVLYAPSQALLFGFTFKQTLAWIAAGFPFDVIHAVGNTVSGLLICPLIALLRKTKEPIER